MHFTWVEQNPLGRFIWRTDLCLTLCARTNTLRGMKSTTYRLPNGSLVCVEMPADRHPALWMKIRLSNGEYRTAMRCWSGAVAA